MKTVGEFKKAGLVFVEGDYVLSITDDHKSEGADLFIECVIERTGTNWLSIGENAYAHKDWVLKQFAWRENTWVKPEFNGLVDAIIGGKTYDEWTDVHVDFLSWELGHDCPTVKWRPSLNQPQKWPDNSRMDIIGQNGNDGLHYDNTAQQVEALAANHTLLQPRNPDPIFRTNEDAQKSLNEHLAKLAEPKPIFTQAMADAGELPPVGSKVIFNANGGSDFSNEYELGLSDGDEVEIIAHFHAGKLLVAAFTYSISSGKLVSQSDATGFKPIDTRTDREKAIDEMLELDLWATDREFLEAVYDAGYRKC